MDFDVKGKKILVAGLGLHGGGVGTVKFLARKGARIIVTDLRKKEQLLVSLKKLNTLHGITYVLGMHRMNDFFNADLIIKNPGIPPSSPYLIAARKKKIPITTDLGIFFRLCPATIVGVTGTRGKSTTAFLISSFLDDFFKKERHTKKRKVFLGGNIRTSALDFIDRLNSRDVVVLELSSFQLDDLLHDSWHVFPRERKSPHIAVLTNILRDHLNWHGTMRSYIAAKSCIFKFQKKDDILFINESDPKVKRMAAHAPSHVFAPQLPSRWQAIVDEKLGRHYRASIALAIAVGRHFGVPLSLIQATLKTFNGLPGRQERMGIIRGVAVINDTTATIPDAAIAAIMRFRILARPPHRLTLIAGGSDKKLNFAPLAAAIAKHVDHLILLPGSGTEKLKSILQKNKRIDRGAWQETQSMSHAVAIAFAAAMKGDCILLSPGAASFGLFENEFDRGDVFARTIARYR